ncbi:hypothetical protein Hanom_Chr16g01428491 [Helianthus anomalus]
MSPWHDNYGGWQLSSCNPYYSQCAMSVTVKSHILFICCLLCWYGVSILYFHLFGILFSSDCLYMKLLQVNDDSNRGDGSESGFGGSDNVEGAFGGEQDIPTDSSSTSRW